ncbi:RagB/SusD family nutrient uptake outer membrane protein [Mucilaginibacter gossypii]|uniref:RagB/SusD family nutrient uptake outer membrane protein n=1 Tax=Mucilaginibacter gossypii TaxID=551996 RepID=UPI000DCEEA66|nr:MULTISPECIES: RagB/SusD family nutrient uptake outer membrane protein [Mucilaginibacter]QTE37117.1 RagB/SusD family nutrient uptake outer membrane protein [Mucilaginibacter gossypii]RAV59096.1 RagB/SusD family nutrient uptake outer membrane protein [Mucilaginibacter rubeus]
MKKNIYLFLSLAAIGFYGCKKDYLNLQPTDTQNSANFFKTKAQFVQAINGAYAPLQGLYNGSFWAMGEMRSDNTSYEYDPYDRSGNNKEELDEFRELNNNDIVQAYFSSCFTGIGRCNVIINRLPAAKLDAATTDTIGGQALFLRAFNYFNLVRMFGDVPLVLVEPKSVGDAYDLSTKSPEAAVYTQIIADAQAAIAKLPVKYQTTANKGRVTKGTAETMLAEVYMTQKKFDLAIPLLRSVISSGAYNLNANYADNFDIAKENGPESIFQIQYIEGPNGLGADFIDTFIPWDYYDNDVTGFYIGNNAQNGWNIPTQDLVNAYEEGDKRKDASLINFTSDEYGIDLPFIKKYQSIGSVQGITGNNFPVYRYADVYLMLAECLNEQGFAAGGDAFKYLNLVRQRAGLEPKSMGNANPDLNVTSQEEFRAAIAHERQVELAFENHRWFDLLRTGKAVEVMKAHAISERAYKNSSWQINSAAYSNIRLLFQYPLNEANLEH